jgi:hypothetical protein
MTILRTLGLALALSFAFTGQASAASCSFTGAAGGSWHTASNWSCNEVPDSGDSVDIAAGDNVSVAAAATASSLALSSSGRISFAGDPTLAVSGPMTADHSGATGTIAGGGTLTVGGTFTKSGDAQLSITNDATFGFSPEVNLNGAATLNGGTMCIADSGDGNPDLPNLHINSTFTIAPGASLNPFPCTPGPRIHVNPTGHLIKASSGTTNIFHGIENDGTVTAQNGTLSLDGPSSVDAPNGGATVTNDGDYIASFGATISFANSHSVSSQGRVGGAGTISVGHGSLSMAAGSALDPAVLNLILTGSLTLDGTSAVTLPTLNLNGGGFNPGFDTDRPVTATALSVTGAGTISGGGSVTVPSGGSFSKTGPGSLTVTNSGSGPSADLILNLDARLDGGSICVGDSSDAHPDLPSMQINQDFTIGSGADAVTFTCSANVITVNGRDGHLTKEGPGTITNHGRFDVAGGMLSIAAGQTFNVVNGIRQSGGLTSIASGGVLQGSATLTGGTLRGAGQVTGNLTNTSGTVEPGSSPGTLTVGGDYTQGSGGTLATEIAGTTPGTQFDRLSVGGTATLDGTLAIQNAPAFDPAVSDTFEILSAGSVSGTFAALTGASQPSGKTYSANYDADSVTLSVAQSPPDNTSPPAIGGDPVDGRTLTCNVGTWTGAPSFTHEWLRDGVQIPGATGSTYTLTPDDVGKRITCRVTGTNGAGSDQGTSSPVTPSAKPAGPSSPPPGNPLISAAGCLNTDGTLTGRQLGPARLGRRLAEQRAIFQGANRQTRANLDRFCAEGGGNFRIGYPTPRLTRTISRALARKVKDRVVIVLTSSRRFSLAGIKVGDSVSKARSRLAREKAFRIGSNTWYVAKRGSARLLVKTKNGRVGEIGIGDPRLSTTAKATKRFLNAWKIG